MTKENKILDIKKRGYKIIFNKGISISIKKNNIKQKYHSINEAHISLYGY